MQLVEGAGRGMGTVVGALTVTCPDLLPTPPPVSEQTRFHETWTRCEGVAETTTATLCGEFAVPDAEATA